MLKGSLYVVVVTPDMPAIRVGRTQRWGIDEYETLDDTIDVWSSRPRQKIRVPLTESTSKSQIVVTLSIMQ